MSIAKKQILSTLFVAVLLCYRPLVGDNTLVIHLKHAPEGIITDVEHDFEKQQKPSIVTKKIKKNNTVKVKKSTVRSILKPKLSGFNCIYGGYTDISDPDGLITFPLRHSGDKVSVAIAPRINLIHFQDNTILHATYPEGTKRYLFTKNVVAVEKKAEQTPAPAVPAPTPSPEDQPSTYWEVTEQPVKAGEKVDVSNTIIILTNPNNIAVMPGKYLAGKGVQFVLPSAIYIIGNTNNEKDLINRLNILGFFERIATEKKIPKENIEQRRMTNL